MKKLIILIMVLIPFNIYGKELIPNSRSGILIEANSGKIIYSKNIDKRDYVASMTKMVGEAIILEEIEKKNIKWSDIVVASRNAASFGGSQIYLEEGEKISVEDLMKGISIASGNDAMVLMAEYISGSEEEFVKRMNEYVKKLRLKNTHFVNSTGLDVDGHYSSSYDMAMIARDLVINHSEVLRFSSIYEDYLRVNSPRKFWLVNTNKLINFYDGADGLKTGHTDKAGYAIAATAKRGNLRLIGVVLGENDSKVRNREVMDLLDYGFSTIKMKTLKNKDSLVKKIKLEKANKKYLDIRLSSNLEVIEDYGSNNKYDYKVNIKKLKYPIKKGSSIGSIVAINRGRVVSSCSLISNSRINKIGLDKLIINNIISLVYGILE